MTRREDSPPEESLPACDVDECDVAANLWVYRADRDRWNALCDRHTVTLHGSLEVGTWLESGYAKPIELERPTEAPDPPDTNRAGAFRSIIHDAMGWPEAAGAE